MTLGLTSDGMVAWVDDTLLIGPKARRHAERGDASSREQWMDLPTGFARARWYIDTDTGNTVAVLENGLIAAVSRTGQVDTVYRDKLAAIKIASKRWQELK